MCVCMTVEERKCSSTLCRPMQTQSSPFSEKALVYVHPLTKLFSVQPSTINELLTALVPLTEAVLCAGGVCKGNWFSLLVVHSLQWGAVITQTFSKCFD